ncbi:MAG: CoA pyrophosphatase [Dehalococcoidales bacterium]|nr:CoA pyrophosphatase [Dehalococcoidales bacterium]
MLAERQVLRITNSKLTVAAVLVPIYLKDGEYHILFIQRTERVRDHKGQISFPGGAYEEEDKVLRNTALREAEEEIGLTPTDVTVLGELDDMPTTATHYVISPFVGLIPYPYRFKLDEWETEELIEVPVAALLDKYCFSEGSMIVGEREMVSYFFRYGDKIIWGATARILKQFLEIIASLKVY